MMGTCKATGCAQRGKVKAESHPAPDPGFEPPRSLKAETAVSFHVDDVIIPMSDRLLAPVIRVEPCE